MLPPVLEIYVVSHPGDAACEAIADAIIDHFHGTPFTGLIGGAIEVFVRSAGWAGLEDSPRAIPFADGDLPAGMKRSAFVAVVPLMGNELAHAVGKDGAWRAYLERLAKARADSPGEVGIYPYQVDHGVLDGTHLGNLLGGIQRIAASPPDADGDSSHALICRDLAQGIAQHLGLAGAPLTVFLSHTKRHSQGDGEDTSGVVQLVREVILATRLQEFFDASDLRVGEDWDAALRANAGRNAMLAIRTDLYPSREWCQREIRIAKQSGMPVIFMDAPGPGEERGSFLMDHVPRIPIGKDNGQWRRRDVYRALNLLVDECLKRILWGHQQRLAIAQNALPVSWWAPHAPEPLTLLDWLAAQRAKKAWPVQNGQLVILHPDPPLGPDEKAVLDQILEVAGVEQKLDIMTPRLLAARGG